MMSDDITPEDMIDFHGITTEYSEIKSIVLQFGNYKVMEVYTDKNPFAEILNFGID